MVEKGKLILSIQIIEFHDKNTMGIQSKDIGLKKWGAEAMQLMFSKELYTKEALIKAAYHFTSNSYVHLDANEHFYIVDISPKSDNVASEFENDFKNEILAQMARIVVLKQTGHLRELLLGRALASTIIEPVIEEQDQLEEDLPLDIILQDWFDENESC